MTIPTVPAVRPKPSATRAIFTAGSPGASRLTTIAAMIRARNALRRSRTIPARIVAIPTSRISVGGMRAPWWVEQLGPARALQNVRGETDGATLSTNAQGEVAGLGAWRH